MESENQNRVKMNVSLTAKGFYQFDITSEFPTVEESAKNLSEAIDSVRKIMEEKNIKEAGKED